MRFGVSLLMWGLTALSAGQRPAAGQTASQASGGRPEPVRETQPCVVSRIVDGDTMDCEPLGRIRLIGMDTPEAAQEPFGKMATDALAGLVPVGTEVLVEPDVEARDQYGRLLGYVWADSVLVNWQMVRQGYAVLLTYPPNVQHVEWLTAAQTAAREESLGLWAVDGFACLPVDFRRGRCGGSPAGAFSPMRSGPRPAGR